jgi:dTDP-4-dehydrorhamnose reductase
MPKPLTLVTGANGQLGNEIKDLSSSYPQFNFVFFGREEFPVNNEQIAGKIFSQYKPSYLLNCAAYTAVDKAETEKEKAKEINGDAVGTLALLSKKFGVKFIHISTDYVFNGEARQPLKEEATVDPVNYYGESKLLGEQLAFQNHPDSVIIRTSWVYSSYGNNFVKTMMRLMGEKESIGVVNDQTGSPTYAADLAEGLLKIINGDKWVPGIYNYSNDGIITWFEFATAIRDLTGSSCAVKPISTEQFPTPAKRPAYSVLDKTKITETYGVKIKDWKESLQVCLKKLQSK